MFWSLQIENDQNCLVIEKASFKLALLKIKLEVALREVSIQLLGYDETKNPKTLFKRKDFGSECLCVFSSRFDSPKV